MHIELPGSSLDYTSSLDFTQTFLLESVFIVFSLEIYSQKLQREF